MNAASTRHYAPGPSHPCQQGERVIKDLFRNLCRAGLSSGGGGNRTGLASGGNVLAVVIVAIFAGVAAAGPSSPGPVDNPNDRALGAERDAPRLPDDPPMGTAFTYQGRLLDGGLPADGVYDFRFVLCGIDYCFDGPVIKEDVEVHGGLFTTDVDFGEDPDHFNGEARWLDIHVRPGASTGEFTMLDPMQELSPAPYAQYAAAAGGGGADGDWTISGNDMYATVSGNVGIGMTNPATKLEVSASGSSTSIVKVTNSGGSYAHGILAESGTGSNSWGMYTHGRGSGGGIYARGDGWHGVFGECYSTVPSHAAVYGRRVPETGWAGYFVGNVHATGNITCGGTKSFKIDHPLDPANKYLYHYCVESHEVINVYSGNVILDAAGEAWVELPAWFEAVNRDFRYQLTCIGGFAPVYVAEKISDNGFKIGGGEPGMELSWQVAAIRNDARVNSQHPPVEVDKPAEERGKYLDPQAYGLPEEMAVHYSMRPPSLDVSTQSRSED